MSKSGSKAKRTPNFHYQVLNHRPEVEPGSQSEWDLFITAALLALFEKEPDVKRMPLSERDETFDEYIIFQARTNLGWRICLSSEVQFRMSKWAQEPSGPKKFERLGIAMAYCSRILQGAAKPLITDPDHYRGKKEMSEELVALFRLISDFTRKRRTLPNVDELVEFIKASVPSDDVFPLLWLNRDAFVEYVRDGAGGRTEQLRAGQKLSPSTFYDEWMGERTRHDPERFRQLVSKIGSLRN